MTAARAEVPGLTAPDAEALAFPRTLLDGVRSALILFASGRGGAADGRWFAEAGIDDVTLVDWDAATLGRMREYSPKAWRFVLGNVMAGTPTGILAASFDHVSADPPSQLAPQIVEMLPRWLACATRSATITLYRHCFAGEPSLDAPELVPPVGWLFTGLIRRSDFRGGIYWLVAEHA